MAESIDINRVGKLFCDCFPFSVEVTAHESTISAPILPSERALVQRAVLRRQADFVAGRWCAHQALLKLGFPVSHIAIGARGEPKWPQGVTGSITHESGICVAAVARQAEVQCLGIDLMDTTRNIDLTDLSDLFMNPADTCAHSEQLSENHRAMLFFTIKESVVKTVSNSVADYLDLAKISVRILEGRAFQANVPTQSAQVKGVWRHEGTFFLTAAFYC